MAAKELYDVIKPFLPQDLADSSSFKLDIKYGVKADRTNAEALANEVCDLIRRKGRSSLYERDELNLREALAKAIKYDGKVY